MICHEFIESYCKKYQPVFYKDMIATNGHRRRLTPHKLYEIRLFIYTLRIYYEYSYTEIKEIIGLDRMAIQKHFYYVKKNKTMQLVAQQRYKELMNGHSSVSNT